MEVFSKLYIFISIILIALFNPGHAQEINQMSAFITQVQSVPSGSSSAKIQCAFKLMKSESNYFMRIAEGSDTCEQLTRTEVIGSAFEQGYEYFEISTSSHITIPPVKYIEMVKHHLYDVVTVGDRFGFLFEKFETSRVAIAFRNEEDTILRLADRSTLVELYDHFNGNKGAVESPSYPFSDMKTYTIVFEVLETKWKIYIDNEEWAEFVHRHSITLITKIHVAITYGIKYLSKDTHPKM